MRFKKGVIPWCKGKTKKEFPQLGKGGRDKGCIPWNKGLTKDVDERVKKYGEKGALNRKGKKPSIETRLKMSETRKGKKHSEEWNKNIGLGNKGKLMSEEAKVKIKLARAKQIFTEETRRKKSEALRGAKCYRWKGGITALNHLIRMSVETKLWRESVFKRDNYTCVWCGDNKGGNLNADHIKSFAQILKKYEIKSLEDAINCRELWDINNGRTLCKSCHKKTDTYAGKGFKRIKT